MATTQFNRHSKEKRRARKLYSDKPKENNLYVTRLRGNTHNRRHVPADTIIVNRQLVFHLQKLCDRHCSGCRCLPRIDYSATELDSCATRVFSNTPLLVCRGRSRRQEKACDCKKACARATKSCWMPSAPNALLTFCDQAKQTTLPMRPEIVYVDSTCLWRMSRQKP